MFSLDVFLYHEFILKRQVPSIKEGLKGVRKVLMLAINIQVYKKDFSDRNHTPNRIIRIVDKLAAYRGLTPPEYSTGQYVRQGRITRC